MSKAGWCRRRLRLAAAAKLRAAAAFPAGWRPQHCNLLLAKWNSGARGGNQPHREALKGEISCLHAGGGAPFSLTPSPCPQNGDRITCPPWTDAGHGSVTRGLLQS